MTPRAVLVEWVDQVHIGPGSWVARDVLDGCEPCGALTVGWLMAETDDAYVLAQSLTDVDATGVFVIVKSCVRRFEQLRPVGRSRSSSPPFRGWLSRWLSGGDDG